ncbi:hypothetical protein [Nocardia kruczakiae]|uniref:hypothetical protein n=1 Tax=Nocardia kruczakiae TaxID=261477 RepID=UPI0012ED3E55|nr:hypothetical protein [Nocardia kruczakiae]
MVALSASQAADLEYAGFDEQVDYVAQRFSVLRQLAPRELPMRLGYAQHRMVAGYIAQSACQVMVSLEVFAEGRAGAGRRLFEILGVGGPNALQPCSRLASPRWRSQRRFWYCSAGAAPANGSATCRVTANNPHHSKGSPG